MSTDDEIRSRGFGREAGLADGDEPNLLDAMPGADADGIVEALDEIARRIGARGNAISITFTAPEHRGERCPRICLRGYKLPHPTAETMVDLIEMAKPRRKPKTPPEPD